MNIYIYEYIYIYIRSSQTTVFALINSLWIVKKRSKFHRWEK